MVTTQAPEPFVVLVSGMSCGGCVKSVTNALLRVDPQAVVEVDLAGGRARIAGRIAPEAALQAITAAGFGGTLP